MYDEICFMDHGKNKSRKLETVIERGIVFRAGDPVV